MTGTQKYTSMWDYPVAPATPVKTTTVHYGFALLAIFALLGTLGPCGFWLLVAVGISSDPDPQTQEAAWLPLLLGLGWLLWGGMWTTVWSAFAFSRTQGRA